ncbi:transmembrane protein 267 [Phlebotomus argentipes]|uniref:transmembrane protein 267 n=1 Tax=Phlebotomus argentipes TaxID=94469 RepID=UPI002892D243|nr:transmembrane protein 267 [Phlebotomus argentipes]
MSHRKCKQKMFAKIYNFRVFISILLCFVCILGDFLTNRARNGSVTKALLDNTTHGVVGLLSALLPVGHFRERLGPWEGTGMLIVAYIVASAIDVDHFLEAKSLKLVDALNLPSRPFLHCSTIPLLILILILITTRYFKSLSACLWLCVIFLAFASHHVRDSIRRGLWFCPLGSTQPTPYTLYLLTTALLPQIVILLISWSPQFKTPVLAQQSEEFTV